MPLNPRSRAVVEYRLDHPDATMRAIGERFGVTRERVRQILKAAGAPTKSQSYGHKQHRACAVCGLPKPSNYSPRCWECHRARISMPRTCQ